MSPTSLQESEGHRIDESLQPLQELRIRWSVEFRIHRAALAWRLRRDGADFPMRDPRSRDASDPGCKFLSVILLAGLGLNTWLGWRLADPLAALAMVPLIAKEGIEARRGEGIEARRGETCCEC